jgi:tyrosinase
MRLVPLLTTLLTWTEQLQQILAGHAQAIAKNYPPASAPIYQAAADNFRIPYWDWGLNANMPDITNSQTVQITTPTGIRSVNNPLFAYKFQTYPLNPSYFPPGQDYPLPTYRQTTREPFGTINSRLRSEGFQRRTVCSLKPLFDNKLAG